MSYDKSIKELERIVEKLSDDKLGMEESLDLYSKGINVAKEALEALNAFKLKIELLNNDLTSLNIEDNEDENDDN